MPNFIPGPHLSFLKRTETVQIVKVRALSGAELTLIDDARDKVVAFSNHNKLWQVAHMNADDFKQYLKYVGDQHAIAGGMDEHSMLNAIFNGNRLFLNVLTALRTFRDHSRTNAFRRHGRHSDFVDKWEAMLSKHESSSLAYRFFYDLRNYVQHCGMPLGRAQFNSQAAPGGAVVHAAEFSFLRDELLRNYQKWDADVKRYLQNMEEQFQVMPYLNETLEVAGRIALGTMELELPLVQDGIGTFDNLFGEISESGATPCIVEFTGDGSEPQMRITYFPLAAIAMAKQYVRDFEANRVPSSL